MGTGRAEKQTGVDILSTGRQWHDTQEAVHSVLGTNLLEEK